MGDVLEDDFNQGSAGASATYPQQCSALRKNGFVMIKGRPCKIVEMSTSKTGKHGHAKVHLVALDIFTGKKLEDICPSTHNMDVPNVSRNDFQFLDFEDEYLQLMDDNGEEYQVKISADTSTTLVEEIKEKQKKDESFLVTVLSACGEEMAVGTKAMNK